MRKIYALVIYMLFVQLYISSAIAQCNCSCNITISTVYNGNLTVMTGDSVCVTPTGVVNGNITLSSGGKLCNEGIIRGGLTLTNGGVLDKEVLCNKGQYYLTSLAPYVHCVVNNYGTMVICGDIPGVKSFKVNNYAGACLYVGGNVKGVNGTHPDWYLGG
ncbi:MAG: hypothetical protein HYU69_13730 [Bacteroidetes bacterium]|nr:hypothetical protein [Bacteroidota bacterium]